AAEEKLKKLQQMARKIEASNQEEGVVPHMMAAPVEPPRRPIATPARGTDVLVRPVSTDAQPQSQDLWEEALPAGSKATDGLEEPASMNAEPKASAETGQLEETESARPNGPVEPEHPTTFAEAHMGSDSDDELVMECDCDFHELRELLHASLVKEEIAAPLTPTEAFNQRMEIVIRNIKEGKVVIDSGYYTEATMKSELNFDKDRIKAIVKYCTASKARRKALTRKDKYQSHIVEYWVDVRTSGSLSRSTKEEFNQFVEVIDSNASLPAPTLGDEALPCYDEDNDDEDDSEDEDDEVNVEDKTPSTKRRRPKKRGKKTPSPKSKLLAKQKKEKQEKEEAVESALEANCVIKLIPAILIPCLF
ncbi:unnamed protein product, partial [Symbiodinium necroappetens]